MMSTVSRSIVMAIVFVLSAGLMAVFAQSVSDPQPSDPKPDPRSGTPGHERSPDATGPLGGPVDAPGLGPTGFNNSGYRDIGLTEGQLEDMSAVEGEYAAPIEAIRTERRALLAEGREEFESDDPDVQRLVEIEKRLQRLSIAEHRLYAKWREDEMKVLGDDQYHKMAERRFGRSTLGKAPEGKPSESDRDR